MQPKFARTDLASEAQQKLTELSGSIDGVEAETRSIHNFPLTEVRVVTSAGAEALGKPVGKYFTLELDDFISRRENSFTDAALALSELLQSFDEVKGAKCCLIACLGNDGVTPDAIGPDAADSVIVTRHLKESMPQEFASFGSVAVWRTGVLGTTGIESAVSIGAVCREVSPDCVIVIDALASGEIGRLCKNVQICDSGIAPGSGVGNDRSALSRETLGVPVIAVGVPTVVDAGAFTDAEEAKGLFVTPRNIDELVKSTAKLLAYGINLALHPGLTVTDIDLLIE